MTDTIRPYQSKAITEIRNFFLKGIKKVLLWMPTGSGKTFVFCRMIKEAASRGKFVIVVVRGRKLVDQASKRLFREGVEHGVLMAKHWNFRPDLPIQVCSIDTLIARKLRPKADLIVIDEAHMAVSKGYKDFLKLYNTFIVSVTATPYSERGTLRHIAQEVVRPITMNELIAQGNLIDFRYFAPDNPDLTGVDVSKSTGDYVVDQLGDVMIQGKLTGKIVDHWIQNAYGIPTLGFAVNIRHSKFLVENFIAAGIPAEHMDANTPTNEREAIIERLQNGITKIIWSVGVLITGVDIPCLGALIMGRPTMSYNLFVQMAGRGTRPFEGMENCLLFDHAGNLEEHLFPTDEPEPNLDGRAIKKQSKLKVCPECFRVYTETKCPECGYIKLRGDGSGEAILEESDDKLVEIIVEKISPEERSLKKFIKEAKKNSKKKIWAYHKLVDKFGIDRCKELLPDYFVKKFSIENIFSNSPYSRH